jgi:hypothetical protein
MGEDVVGVGTGVDGLLHEPVPQHATGAAGAPVEAEGELVEVVAEVRVGLAVVEGAGESAFERRGDLLYRRKEFVGRARRAHEDDRHVLQSKAAGGFGIGTYKRSRRQPRSIGHIGCLAVMLFATIGRRLRTAGIAARYLQQTSGV